MTNAKDHLKSTTYYSHLHHLSELPDLHSFTKLMILREPGTVLEFSFQGSVREAIKPLHDPMKKSKTKTEGKRVKFVGKNLFKNGELYLPRNEGLGSHEEPSLKIITWNVNGSP